MIAEAPSPGIVVLPIVTSEPQELRKASKYLRILVLFLASFLTIGSYFVYDTPSSLYGQLQEHFMFYNDDINTDTFELYFNLLYSVYSIPNVLLPFVGGHLVDTVGMRLCIMGFSLTVLLGQLITALGCTLHSMATMLLGRLIFGLGGECLVVGQSAFISAWFQDKELAFALGFVLSISRLGSILNDWVSPRVSELYGVNAAFWLGSILCLLSSITAILLSCIDRSHRLTHKGGNASGPGTVSPAYRPIAEPQPQRPHSAFGHGTYFQTPLSRTPDIVQRIDPAELGLGSAGGGGGGPHELRSEELRERLTRLALQTRMIHEDDLWHLLGFQTVFWLLATVCLLSYGAIMPFNNIANVYLMTYYLRIKEPKPEGADCTFRPLLPEWLPYCEEVNRARTRAGTLQSVPFIICGVLTPMIGIIIDNHGNRTSYILLGPVLLCITHTLFLLRNTSAILPLIGLGLGYSIIAAVVWPSVPLAIQDDDSSSRRCGTAFGILTAFQNLSMAIFPIALAALYEITHNHAYGEYFFIAVSIAGVVTAVALYIEDERNGGVLRKRVMTRSPRSMSSGHGTIAQGPLIVNDDCCHHCGHPRAPSRGEGGFGEKDPLNVGGNLALYTE